MPLAILGADRRRHRLCVRRRQATRTSFWRWSRSPPSSASGSTSCSASTGQVSLGHVGFYAIGAYTAAILTLQGRRASGSPFRSPALIAGVVGAAARAAGAARDRALSRDGHHRVRLHRPARHDRMARADRRRERPDGHHAAGARLARLSPSARWRCWRSARRRSRSISSTGSPAAPGARRMVAVRDSRDRGALDRAQSGDHQDRGVRAVGGVHRASPARSSRR